MMTTRLSLFGSDVWTKQEVNEFHVKLAKKAVGQNVGHEIVALLANHVFAAQKEVDLSVAKYVDKLVAINEEVHVNLMGGVVVPPGYKLTVNWDGDVLSCEPLESDE